MRDSDAENEVFNVTARLSGAMTGARDGQPPPLTAVAVPGVAD